jgi:serine/threonine protein kinase
MVLELAEGEPLSQILTMPLPPERVIALTTQLLHALEHAHAAGLVHRDLKPDNVMVAWQDGREHLRIVDFGIAILRDEQDVARLTGVGQMIGTPIYMSPEQAKCESVDQRTDLFALGVIVYEMLSGMLPFEGGAMEIALSNVNKEPPRFAERVPGLIIDPMLEAFCRKLMARKIEQRFTSARAALDVLEVLAVDPAEAGLRMGIMDVAKAMAVVSLSDPPGS